VDRPALPASLVLPCSRLPTFHDETQRLAVSHGASAVRSAVGRDADPKEHAGIFRFQQIERLTPNPAHVAVPPIGAAFIIAPGSQRDAPQAAPTGYVYEVSGRVAVTPQAASVLGGSRR